MSGWVQLCASGVSVAVVPALQFLMSRNEPTEREHLMREKKTQLCSCFEN